MNCEVEVTDEFTGWWNALTTEEQDSVARIVQLLEAKGLALGYPYSSQINSSKHGHMRELRIQHQGRPYRVFYAFNPERNAILLIGGDKTGNDRFYELYVPLADSIYDAHLAELAAEKTPDLTRRRRRRRWRRSGASSTTRFQPIDGHALRHRSRRT